MKRSDAEAEPFPAGSSKRQRTLHPGVQAIGWEGAVCTIPIEKSKELKSGADIHFRIAEGAFLRHAHSPRRRYSVNKVEFIVNAKCRKNFVRRKAQLESQLGSVPGTAPVFAFHGTEAENVLPIVCENFDVGLSGKKTGNDGFYGKGVYFSENATHCLPYISGGNIVLLCKILLGRPFLMDKIDMGAPLRQGYHSHISPDGTEVVVFDSAQILPSYVVHFSFEPFGETGDSLGADES